MRGLSRILSLFPDKLYMPRAQGPRHTDTITDKLDKFNNTGARLLGSIYCMTLKLLLNRV